jgi:hypothetical protein
MHGTKSNVHENDSGKPDHGVASAPSVPRQRGIEVNLAFLAMGDCVFDRRGAALAVDRLLVG